MRNTDNAG